MKCNFKEQYLPNLICNSCKLAECNKAHLLQCSALIGSNELLIYIPEYEYIFDDSKTQEQEYIAQLMMKSLEKKFFKDNPYLIAQRPCAPVYRGLLQISVVLDKID